MCGFVGFTGDPDEGVLHSMTTAIAHRGPDDADYYWAPGISLGFRRLSIIDLEGGRQPILNEDESKALVFNGEIYNYWDIRQKLIEAGHKFRTEADSEVILHGYEEYGPKILDRVRGMFAFAIWDREKGELFGARDFFGIKPLYYAEMGGVFMFGSEIKSFLHHPAFKKELNRRALENYLSFQYSPGPETFFENVYKLPPAHYFTYRDGKMETVRYWLPEFHAEEDKSLDYWVDEIEKVFDDSVRAHKVSDVEVGSFLSSGVDSSYVACSANVDKTFTVGFDNGEKYNETSYAKELSELIPVKNISKVITPEEFWGNFPKIQYHMDEPLADPSAVALYFVCNTASKYVKVVLSGEGADEMFGGYNVYKEPLAVGKYQRCLPRFVRKGIASMARKLPDFHGKNFLIRGSQTVEERYIGNSYVFHEGEREQYLKKDYGAKPPQFYTKPFYDQVPEQDDVTKMQYMDIHVWMVQEILLKADKMSMAHSLELRVPFLDKEIFRVASAIPQKYKVSKENTKLALRKAAGRYFNAESANRRKLAFPLPLPEWLREERYYQMVKGYFTNESAARFFNTDQLVKLLDDHRAGKPLLSAKIWAVFSFLLWYEQYFVLKR